MHLYHGCGAKMSDRFQNELANVMRGMKRKVVKQKENLVPKADEGKYRCLSMYTKNCAS